MQFQARTHRPDLPVDEIALPEVGVAAAEPVGYEHLDGSPQQVLSGVAEERLGLGVDQLDGAPLVDDHHGVGRRLQQGPEARIGGSALADVPYGRGDQQAFGRLQRAQADLDGELTPVPAQP